VNQPANGTVGLSGSTATFRPAPGFEGKDGFQVAAWGSSGTAIAPGELLSIYGSGLGGAAPAGMQVNPAGPVNRSLAGTRVLFDAVAPWALAGKSATLPQFSSTAL
jgi:hypothetical protein